MTAPPSAPSLRRLPMAVRSDRRDGHQRLRFHSFGSKERRCQEAAEACMATAGKWYAKELNAKTDMKTAFHRLLTAARRRHSAAAAVLCASSSLSA